MRMVLSHSHLQACTTPRWRALAHHARAQSKDMEAASRRVRREAAHRHALPLGGTHSRCSPGTLCSSTG
eukprot:6185623-Prymnesium_polylepis.1